MQVLYAEDEYTNRKLFQIQLGKLGVKCDLAEDGEQALSMALSGNYDCIILDFFMPGLDGGQVARKVREVKPTIPLVAITSDSDSIPELKRSGFDDIFIKPMLDQRYAIRVVELAQQRKQPPSL